MQVDWKRLAFYLLINAVVSAAVTLTVLWLWDRTRSPTSTLPPTDIAALPTTAGTPAPTSLAPPVDLSHLPTVTPIIYVVESGDTLGAIAIKFDVPVEDLMAANGLTDPNVLEVGQSLIIPIGGVAPPTAEGPAAPPASATPAVPFPTATTNPNTDAPRLIIQQVISPGDIGKEAVRLTNLGGAVELAGWALEDSAGNRFVFPKLTLHQNGAVTIHTMAGTNSVIDLYWGATAAVWQVGETVTLRQPDGVVHTTFIVK